MDGKAGRMTIVKRGKRWGVKVWNPVKGSYDWIGTFDLKKEARQAEQDAQKRAAKLGVTVTEFAAIWQRDYARPSPATRQSYRYGLKGFVGRFGNRRLDSITRPEARAWATSNPQANGRIVRAMFGDALRDGIIDFNPFSGLRLQQPRGRKDLTALTENEIDQLADTALACLPGDIGPTMSAMILIAAYCGPRPGELMELKWTDVHGDELNISRSLDATGQIKLPKNNLTRTVAIPQRAMEALRALPRQPDTDYMFVGPRGGRFTKNTLNHWWRQIRQAAGRPEMAFYELRHACATMLLERGLTPADTAIQLGHTDGGRLVQEVYGHPAEQGARERIKEAFEDTPKNTRKRRAS